MKLSIVIPVFNEARAITEVLERVKRARLPSGWEKEIIAVDDGSTDETQEILRKLFDPEVQVLYKGKNEGKGSALKLGFSHCTGDYIVIQDADFEYNPEEYARLLVPIIQKQADIVFGSRNMGGNHVTFSAVYFYGGLAVTKVFNLFFGTKLSDVATCYKVFPRSLVPRLVSLPGNDFAFDVIELSSVLAQTGKIIEVAVTYVPRTKREGKKINWTHGVKCLVAIGRIKFATTRK